MTRKEAIDRLLELTGLPTSAKMSTKDIMKALEKEEKKHADSKKNEEKNGKKTETPELVEMPEVPVEFTAMCGDHFDPDINSSCFLVCSDEYSESFKACQAHYAANDGKKVEEVKAKKLAKKNNTSATGLRYRPTIWGHALNSQAAMIDHFLEDGVLFTKASLAAALETKESRIAAHIYHLRHEHGAEIFCTPNGYFFWEGHLNGGKDEEEKDS